MIRIAYVGLSVLMAFVPLTFYWAMNRPSATSVTSSGQSSTGYYGRHYGGTYIYYGGGRGGWLSSSYGWGRGDGYRYSRAGGSSLVRGGGPSAGGK